MSKGIDEPSYVSRYLKTIVKHLRDIRDTNPDLTENEIKTILFKEIDDYAKTVYENAYVFDEYLEYVCCEYLSKNYNKYKEISDKLIESDLDFEKMGFQDCRSFDEYLLLYIYRKKKDLFEQIFEGFEDTIPFTPENYKKFDQLLQENLYAVSKSYFTNWFELPDVASVLTSSEPLSKKRAKLKEFSTWYRNPKDKKDFELYSSIFLNSSYAYILTDSPHVTQTLKKDLALSTSRIVEQLDKLGHLENYMTDFVFEMCRMEYPELAGVICNNGFPNKEFSDNISNISKEIVSIEASLDSMPDANRPKAESKLRYLKSRLFSQKSEIAKNLNKDKLKTSLGQNYLSSSKSISLDSLLALNSFWSNRYVKEIDLYSEAMFAVHKFDLVNKVLKNESTFISIDDLTNMLIQMNTFYAPAADFLSIVQNALKNYTPDSDKEYEDGDVEEKIIRFSYDPYIKEVTRQFGHKAYSNRFSRYLPNIEHDVEKDADWYIRLYNPVFSSYLMKNEMLNALLLSIIDQSSESFPNAGIILEDYSGKSTENTTGTEATISYFPILGIDAGLSFPVHIHAKRPDIIDFLVSIKGDAIVPVYEFSEDFHNPYMNNKPLPASLIMPVNDKIKPLFKKGLKKSDSVSKTSQDYHPNARFISHLAFNSSKKVPSHMQTSIGKKNSSFVRRYIDLRTGEIFIKEKDKYVPVTPHGSGNRKTNQGDDEHGL